MPKPAKRQPSRTITTKIQQQKSRPGEAHFAGPFSFGVRNLSAPASNHRRLLHNVHPGNCFLSSGAHASGGEEPGGGSEAKARRMHGNIRDCNEEQNKRQARIEQRPMRKAASIMTPAMYGRMSGCENREFTNRAISSGH